MWSSYVGFLVRFAGLWKCSSIITVPFHFVVEINEASLCTGIMYGAHFNILRDCMIQVQDKCGHMDIMPVYFLMHSFRYY